MEALEREEETLRDRINFCRTQIEKDSARLHDIQELKRGGEYVGEDGLQQRSVKKGVTTEHTSRSSLTDKMSSLLETALKDEDLTTTYLLRPVEEPKVIDNSDNITNKFGHAAKNWVKNAASLKYSFVLLFLWIIGLIIGFCCMLNLLDGLFCIVSAILVIPLSTYGVLRMNW